MSVNTIKKANRVLWKRSSPTSCSVTVPTPSPPCFLVILMTVRRRTKTSWTKETAANITMKAKSAVNIGGSELNVESMVQFLERVAMSGLGGSSARHHYEVIYCNITGKYSLKSDINH
ncbi:hypothetical protein M378DRAFT_172037 [Amanita muscaria Koide BX008]|uniref:Uncharacterized protein n=1 Tax=Amanita muscaria (strain Koide BX008) TaxID=946122 RepID=A0A0C2W7T6_AMAMK|nr:hypothetical protein M378DRAFT_172037 [Amanita muscaria Koide BX008]